MLLFEKYKDKNAISSLYDRETEEKSMENKTLLDRFTELANSRKAEIIDLQAEYLLKQIENEMIQERFKKCRNIVLSEHPYYAERECTRSRSGNNIAAGDRILDCADEWLMSKTDFDEYQKRCLPLYVADGLTDAEGVYTEEGNTENQLRELKERLIIIGVEILPDDFPNKNLLVDAINYKAYKAYETREKIFELVMQLR